MKNLFHRILVFILLSGPAGAWAQDIPTLPKAAEISVGKLPNGMDLYIVRNPSTKGKADFSLVQKGYGHDMSAGREPLSKVNHLGKRTPLEFISSRGVGYGPQGFISYDSHSRRYDFTSVPVSDQSVADSTLMMLFDIASACPGRQAIIISGDVDAAKIPERVQLFSMLTSERNAKTGTEEYVWTPVDSLTVVSSPGPDVDAAEIRIVYNIQRTERKYLNTTVPLVSGMFCELLGIILKERLEKGFSEKGIPLAGVETRYYGCEHGALDEHFTITAITSSSRLKDAVSVLSGTLCSLDTKGADIAELGFARKILAGRSWVGTSHSNSEYIRKCTSDYLYGTGLASLDTDKNFYASRNLPIEKELSFFNGFADALLDSAKNLSIHFHVGKDAAPTDELKKVWKNSWTVSGPAPKSFPCDSVPAYVPLSKIKVKSETKDPVSGGTMWTFANGIRVICKKTSQTGKFDFALMIRGGYPSMKDIPEGAGPYLHDMLELSTVSGTEFRDLTAKLLSEGITLNHEVNLADFRIKGSAPWSKAGMLLDVLMNIGTKRRECSPREFDYYRECMTVRDGFKSFKTRDMDSVLDSLSLSSSPVVPPACLPQDFPAKAERYFASQFSKLSDGIIVFVGDIEQETLKKELCKRLGDFEVQRMYASRPIPGPMAGSNEILSEAIGAPGRKGAEERGAYLKLCIDRDFNLGNYLTFMVSSEVLKKEICKGLAETGAYASVRPRVELLPRERFSVYIEAHPCQMHGLPEGISPSDPEAIMDAIKNILERISEGKADLSGIKEIKSGASFAPDTIDAILTRFSEGKDMVTGYASELNGVSAEKVSQMFKSLCNGSRTGYVIR